MPVSRKEMRMEIVKVNEQPSAENPHGVDVRRIYDKETALASHLTLKPGESLIRHITPVDVLFYVLEGTGTVEIGGEEAEVKTDTAIDSPAGIPHCWRNDSDGVLRLLVVKAPRPVKKTKLL